MPDLLKNIYADPMIATANGMGVAFHANLTPESQAIISSHGDLTFSELNQQANQLVHALREAGISAGDAIALVCSNRGEFVVITQACLRAGLRLTPINWHLSGEEIGYIVNDCEAKVLIAEGRFAQSSALALNHAPRATIRLTIGDSIEGFADYYAYIKEVSGEDIADPILGGSMLYTSGTTGRPKGVFRNPIPGHQPALGIILRESAQLIPQTDLALLTGPAYHAAPFTININLPLAAGVGVVMMDKWDAQETLALIERHRVTHTHMVATMFHRILGLPENIRSKYDLSSLRWLIHGAAPCPVPLKKAMIDWLGPVIYEYYAATEGGNCFIDSPTWLQKPGSVGRPWGDQRVVVMDNVGNVLPAGEAGTVYFEAHSQERFEYFKAPEKTAEAYRGDYFTMGDIGYFDEEGYLFLSGRSAETLISGGVNIYPQEIDNILLQHPLVREVCTVGVPSEEWGESVLSVVELNEGVEPTPELAETLLSFAKERLPGFKTPRGIDFSRDLPRMPTGKIQRHKVREPYWSDTGRLL